MGHHVHALIKANNIKFTAFNIAILNYCSLVKYVAKPYSVIYDIFVFCNCMSCAIVLAGNIFLKRDVALAAFLKELCANIVSRHQKISALVIDSLPRAESIICFFKDLVLSLQLFYYYNSDKFKLHSFIIT